MPICQTVERIEKEEVEEDDDDDGDEERVQTRAYGTALCTCIIYLHFHRETE